VQMLPSLLRALSVCFRDKTMMIESPADEGEEQFRAFVSELIISIHRRMCPPDGTSSGLYLSLLESFRSANSDIAIRWWENRTRIQSTRIPSNNTPKLNSISTAQNLKLHSLCVAYGALRGVRCLNLPIIFRDVGYCQLGQNNTPTMTSVITRICIISCFQSGTVLGFSLDNNSRKTALALWGVHPTDTKEFAVGLHPIAKDRPIA
jgi:hypothetical protein